MFGIYEILTDDTGTQILVSFPLFLFHPLGYVQSEKYLSSLLKLCIYDFGLQVQRNCKMCYFDLGAGVGEGKQMRI